MTANGDRSWGEGGDERDAGTLSDGNRAVGVSSDAFGSLGNETRLSILQTLAEREPTAFSDLYSESDEDTSAGFAYHLRQLRDRFVHQRDDERYELTEAGRTAARDVLAGTYTQSVSQEPVELADPCPICEAARLEADVADNVTEVGCSGCEATVLRLSLPPSAYADRAGADFVEALDTHHRRRIESFTDGVCPNCAGPVDRTIVTSKGTPTEPVRNTGGDSDPRRVQADFTCETCGMTLQCPVALTVLSHPVVVSFYHDHGEDVRARPIWNVGPEWRECLISSDPWCVGVSTRLDDESMFLYLDRDGSVVDHRRQQDSDLTTSGSDDHSGDDDPDGGEYRPADSVETNDVEPPSTGDAELDHSQATDGATA